MNTKPTRIESIRFSNLRLLAWACFGVAACVVGLVAVVAAVIATKPVGIYDRVSADVRWDDAR
jgi:hypothetical protein